MANTGESNIVMFPFMAKGHIIPFIALALEIQQKRGYTITFVNTPQNIIYIKSSIPQTQNSSSSFRFLEIPFSSSYHAFALEIENTDVLPFNLIFPFVQASYSLKDSFRSLFCGLVKKQPDNPPLCIISDIFFGWCAEIAHEFGVFHAIFSVIGAFGMGVYYSSFLNLPHKKTNSSEFTLPDFPEASRIHISQLPYSIHEANGSNSISEYVQKVLPAWKDSDAILFNTVEEIDQIGLLYFRRKLGRPVWGIGPILLTDRAGKQTGITKEFCMKWLKTKPTKSVLYISFGSQNTLLPSNMMQLAVALDKSGKNFIWVVRPPIGHNIDSEFEADKWLPEGFESRINEENRGLIVRKWAPQLEILSSKATAAFVTQCGWNSALESLGNGVPLIGWPMAAEQCFTCKYLEEELGVCVEVARGLACEFGNEHILEKIKMVMSGSDKGNDMRRKACEAKQLIQNATKVEDGFKGSSAIAVGEFFNAALLKKEEAKLKSLKI
ncbi:UDP-glucuronosyl/UDP-glucosyltransferase [Dillenia turbinata]|uniref:Glycosyltransferase n=1 Tax=Dillenia turbinata TaxID=194707 RepID=A0AAN8VL63_9MAGN